MQEHQPLTIQQKGARHGVAIGVRWQPCQEILDENAKKIKPVLPKTFEKWPKKVWNNKRYKRALILMQELFCRAMETQGITKVDNAWVRDALGGFGLKVSDRQICNLFKMLEKNDQIQVIIRRHKQPGYRTGYKTERAVLVWPALMMWRYRIPTSKIFNFRLDFNKNALLKRVPIEFKNVNDEVLNIRGRRVSVPKAWTTEDDVVRKGWIPFEWFHRHKELKYYRNFDQYAPKHRYSHSIRILGYPIGGLIGMRKKGRSISSFIPIDQYQQKVLAKGAHNVSIPN